MAVAARVLETRRSAAPQVRLARSRADVEASLRLRYQVFAEEMGADIDSAGSGLESDDYDRHCHHLLVIDGDHGGLLASTRLLDGERAEHIGGFYSASEFDLSAIEALAGRKLELGRTCVAGHARQGAVIAALWSGIGAFVREGGYDHLLGCTSIDARDGTARARALYAGLGGEQMSPANARVVPRRPLPAADAPGSGRFSRPPLLKGYLRVGATVGGAPYWDQAFRVADLFMHLQIANLCPRYARHFLHRPGAATARPALGLC